MLFKLKEENENLRRENQELLNFIKSRKYYKRKTNFAKEYKNKNKA